jgi:hypothetical protein
MREEGESFAVCLKIRATGFAGQSSAKPKPPGSYFLSWGRGQKVRAGVKYKFHPPQSSIPK